LRRDPEREWSLPGAEWCARGRSAGGSSTSATSAIVGDGTAAWSVAPRDVARASERRVVDTSAAPKAASIIAIGTVPTELVEPVA
jgi:hypothetical protein